MKKLLVALSLAVACLVVWLALDGRRGLRSPIAGDGPDRAATRDGPERPVTPVVRAPVDAASEARRNAPIEDARAAGETTSLLVVMAASGAPVAGADVAWVDLEELLPEEAAEIVREPPLSDRALHARADERGRVRIPRPSGDAWATASSGERSGVVMIPAGSIDARLELRIDEWIDVRVFAHDGRPVPGMTVRLQGRDDGGLASNDGVVRGGLITEDSWRETRLSQDVTDQHGGARLRVRRIDATNAVYWIEADVAAAHGIDVEVALPSPGAAPAAPIELHLPPFGSVEVHLVRPDGSELTEATDVMLLLESPLDGLTGEASTVTSNGRALFPLVETGVDIVVTAVPRDGVTPGIASLAGARAGEGLTVEGEHVTAEVQVEGAFAWLAGRLVDEKGAPLAYTRYEFLALPGSSGLRRTDALGRFSVGVTSETSVLELARTMREGARVRIELGSLDRGTRELGDVVLPIAPH